MYKSLPAPDFCPYTMMQKQINMYDNESRPKYGVETDNTGPFADAQKYQKWMLLYCYWKRHKICPGKIHDGDIDPNRSWTCKYPYIDPHEVPFREVEKVNMTGEFVYNSYGKDYLHAVKDKAICPTHASEMTNAQDLGLLGVEEKNQLLDVLTREDYIDTNDLKQNREHIFYDVKLEDKPEAKKPDGRMFMEAHTDARILQSEYEENVHTYAEFAPGYMAGKSFNDTIKLTNHIYEP